MITAADCVGTDLAIHCEDGHEAAGHLARAFAEMQVRFAQGRPTAAGNALITQYTLRHLSRMR